VTGASPRPSDPLRSGPIFYPIIDTAVCAARGIDPLALALACLRGGARLLQVRQKAGSGASFLALAERLVIESAHFHARLIVNDRADIARLAGAAGVHVGQDDLDVDDVFRIAGMDAIVGLSTHDATQIDAAIGGRATYVAVGPVFGSTTKDTGYGPRGLDLVRYAAGRGKPVVAIGGITLERARDVVAAGADAVAVIGDLAGSDPQARARAFVSAVAPRPFNV